MQRVHLSQGGNGLRVDHGQLRPRVLREGFGKAQQDFKLVACPDRRYPDMGMLLVERVRKRLKELLIAKVPKGEFGQRWFLHAVRR